MPPNTLKGKSCCCAKSCKAVKIRAEVIKLFFFLFFSFFFFSIFFCTWLLFILFFYLVTTRLAYYLCTRGRVVLEMSVKYYNVVSVLNTHSLTALLQELGEDRNDMRAGPVHLLQSYGFAKN